jgi:hypothetical protein
MTCGIAGPALLFYRALWGNFHSFVIAMDHGDLFASDFLLHYHTTAQALFTTATPSPGFFYSCFFALLLTPLGRLDSSRALAVWVVLQSMGALLLLLLPVRQFLRRSPWLAAFYVAACAFSLPLLDNFRWGQVSVFVTLGILQTGMNAPSRRNALGLAVVTAIKYYPALFALHFVASRRWKPLAYFGIWTLVLYGLLPAALLGPRRALEFQRLSFKQARIAEGSWVPVDTNSQYLGHIVPRLLGDGWRKPVGRRLSMALGLALFACNLAALWRDTPSDGNGEIALALLFLSLPLVVETSWPHYFVFLPFCQAVVMDGAQRLPRRDLRWLVRATAALSAILASVPFFAWIGDWQRYEGSGILFFADVSLLGALHLLLWCGAPAGSGGRVASPAGILVERQRRS